MLTRHLIVVGFVAAALAGVARAEDDKNHPCKAVKDACEAAGFHKGDHKDKKKGLFKDCLEPIMAGKTVEGVTVPPAEIEACKAKKGEHEKK